MPDSPGPGADRPPPARPARVARFEGLGVVDGDAADPPAEPAPGVSDGPDGSEDEGASPVAVAGFAGLDSPRRPPVAVAGFDGLGDASRSDVTVAGFDGLGAAPPAAAPVAALDTGTAAGAARRRSPTSATARRDRPSVTDQPPAPDPSPLADDGIPPDRPLPRGRRRGARVGRLGPDAPGLEDPGSGPPEPDADPVAVAREICLRLLTDRARTRQELAQALARKGVPADAAATVLDRFDEVGLIDDVAFAGQWVHSRHTYRGLGRRAIAVELRRKGVADDIAGEALAEVDAESEARRGRELVDRKLRSLTLDTAEQRAVAARRLVGMLARKGYGAGVAYRVVREALAERGAEIDELGTEPTDG
jgi:regulatory protein